MWTKKVLSYSFWYYQKGWFSYYFFWILHKIIMYWNNVKFVAAKITNPPPPLLLNISSPNRWTNWPIIDVDNFSFHIISTLFSIQFQNCGTSICFGLYMHIYSPEHSSIYFNISISSHLSYKGFFLNMLI